MEIQFPEEKKCVFDVIEEERSCVIFDHVSYYFIDSYHFSRSLLKVNGFKKNLTN